MPKPPPRRGKPKKAPPKSPAQPTDRNRCRALSIIDEQPLRQKAVAECHRLEALLAKARGQYEAFETGDLPAFQRWEAKILGPLLTEVRTIEEQIAEKERIADAIEEECLWTDCDPVTAYRRVMSRLQEGRALDGSDEPGEASDREEGDEGEDEGEDFDDPEGFDPEEPAGLLPPGFRPEDYDKMSAAQKRDFREYYESLAELFEMMTGEAAPSLEEALARERARQKGAHGEHHEGPNPLPGAASRAKDRAAKRIKELYRSLVRQLHPDANRKLTPRESELWHQVQEAYRTQDLERMEALAGRVEIGASGDSKNVPVQILRRMAQDLAEGLRSLRKQLEGARKHPAWNFRQRNADLPKYAAQRRKEIERMARAAREELALLDGDLQELAMAAARAAAPKERRTAKKRRIAGDDGLQGTFPF